MQTISEKQHFVGCDVSKKTLDFALHLRGEKLSAFPHIQVSNDKAGFRKMLKWLKDNGVKMADAAVAMEHTGIYSDAFARWLHGKKIVFTMLHPLEVKRFCSRARSKTDKADAQMIADFLYTNREKLSPSEPEPLYIKTLREMLRARAQLVKNRAALKVQLSTMTDPSVCRALEKAIKAMDASIEAIRKDMRLHVSKHPDLERNYTLLLTIKGVGDINALNTIVATSNFTRFQNARQYAKYVCVAPLSCQSGTSVRHGDHVSSQGRCDLKSDLTMSAKSSIQHDREMRSYMERKTREGKAFGSVLNAVKFKIICRMFAVIARGTPYVPRETYRQ